MRWLFLGCALLLLPCLAGAQVVVNHAALEQLAGIAPPPPVIVSLPAPVRHIVMRRRVVHRARPVVVAVAKPVAPMSPVPVVAKPVAPAAAKPVVARVVAPAGIVFAGGSADLPPGAAAALKPFCAAPGTITVSATAPADPGDPSSAMRLAMMRAFAVRGALVACGTPTANILPRTATAAPGKSPDIAQVSLAR